MEASDTVGELLTLQEIDLQILRITRELTGYDAELAELQARVEELDAAIQQITAVKDEADERVRRYQRAVQAGRATLKRLEVKASADAIRVAVEANARSWKYVQAVLRRWAVEGRDAREIDGKPERHSEANRSDEFIERYLERQRARGNR